MLLVISIFISFVYALLYMLMAALPFIYHELSGLTPVSSSLPMISLFVGVMCGGIFTILDMFRYGKHVRNRTASPEQRLYPMGLGAVLLREFLPHRRALTPQPSGCFGSHLQAPRRPTRDGGPSSPFPLPCTA
mgnify:CR=1 FL=1